jgi:hypothetical protein
MYVFRRDADVAVRAIRNIGWIPRILAGASPPPLGYGKRGLSSSGRSPRIHVGTHGATAPLQPIADASVVVGPRGGIPRERAAPPSGAWTVPTRSTGGDD